MKKQQDGRKSETGKTENVDIAPSTAHKYLATLHSERFVVTEGGKYQVGIRFLAVGGYAKQRKPGCEIAAEKVHSLAEQTGERA